MEVVAFRDSASLPLAVCSQRPYVLATDSLSKGSQIHTLVRDAFSEKSRTLSLTAGLSLSAILLSVTTGRQAPVTYPQTLLILRYIPQLASCGCTQ